MTNAQQLRFLRLPEVRSAMGLGTTSVYGLIKRGLFVPPCKLTSKSSGWPAYEVAAINAARLAGKTDAEIRELVANLLAARSQDDMTAPTRRAGAPESPAATP